MRKSILLAAVTAMAMAMSSCDEDTMSIGQSLTNNGDELDLLGSSYGVSTRTIVADSVFTLSNTCYFGHIKDPQTGSSVLSEFTTQFYMLPDTAKTAEDRIVGRYDGKIAADSCRIKLFLSSPFNPSDSLQAIKIRIREMSKPMEEGQRYYSNYNPEKMGMIRTDGLSKEIMFSYPNLKDKDSLRYASGYDNNITIPLNEPYTDVNGITYNNFGTYLLQNYYSHPEYFKNGYAFSHHICPGFFFEITDGQGFYAKVDNVDLYAHYTIKNDKDSVRTATMYMPGTKEVLQTTLVTNDKQTISDMAMETEQTYIKSPAGLFTEVTLPVDEIKRGHENDSILSAQIIFQRINNMSNDPRELPTTPNILMVQKDSLSRFFETYQTPNNKMSYVTSYSTKYNYYEFSNISSLISRLYDIRSKQNENWVNEHPNWNKVVLIPVNTTTSIVNQSSVISSVEHNMGLTSTKLVKGTGNENSPVKINVVYANFH